MSGTFLNPEELRPLLIQSDLASEPVVLRKRTRTRKKLLELGIAKKRWTVAGVVYSIERRPRHFDLEGAWYLSKASKWEKLKQQDVLRRRFRAGFWTAHTVQGKLDFATGWFSSTTSGHCYFLPKGNEVDLQQLVQVNAPLCRLCPFSAPLPTVKLASSEQLAFHGTQTWRAWSILENGFDKRLRGSTHGQYYGSGEYFSRSVEEALRWGETVVITKLKKPDQLSSHALLCRDTAQECPVAVLQTKTI